MISNVFTTADNKYHVVSYGNGWAYEVTCQESGDSFFVQDDQAQQVQDDTNNFENTEVLAEMIHAWGSE